MEGVKKMLKQFLDSISPICLHLAIGRPIGKGKGHRTCVKCGKVFPMKEGSFRIDRRGGYYGRSRL